MFIALRCKIRENGDVLFSNAMLNIFRDAISDATLRTNKRRRVNKAIIAQEENKRYMYREMPIMSK